MQSTSAQFHKPEHYHQTQSQERLSAERLFVLVHKKKLTQQFLDSLSIKDKLVQIQGEARHLLPAHFINYKSDVQLFSFQTLMYLCLERKLHFILCQIILFTCLIFLLYYFIFVLFIMFFLLIPVFFHQLEHFCCKCSFINFNYIYTEESNRSVCGPISCSCDAVVP